MGICCFQGMLTHVKSRSASEIEVQVVAAASGNLLGSWQLPSTASVRDVKDLIPKAEYFPFKISLLFGDTEVLDQQSLASFGAKSYPVVFGCIKNAPCTTWEDESEESVGICLKCGKDGSWHPVAEVCKFWQGNYLAQIPGSELEDMCTTCGLQ